MTNFNDLTHNLGKAYDAQKTAEKEIKGDKQTSGLKQDFFNEATKETTASLAQKTYEVEGRDLGDAMRHAEKYNPGWRVISVEARDEKWNVHLEEDPVFKPFTYVNKKDKRVWQKQIASSSPMLDDEYLQLDNPKLWMQISVPARVMRPLEDLTPKELAKVQEYMYPGPLQVRLAQPRKAKPEELE